MDLHPFLEEAKGRVVGPRVAREQIGLDLSPLVLARDPMAGEEEEDVLSLSEAIRYFFSEQPAQARAGGLIIEDEGRDEAERREPRGDLGGVERRALELGDPRRAAVSNADDERAAPHCARSFGGAVGRATLDIFGHGPLFSGFAIGGSAMGVGEGYEAGSCVPKELPPSRSVEVVRKAAEIDPDNVPSGLPDDITPAEGDRLALDVRRYWGKQGVRLTVGFLDAPPAELRSRILSHMNAWSVHANVAFVESSTDPQVRIDRGGGGYWSYVGTDILLAGAGEPTMNLEGFTMATPEAELVRVVRHEAGHTLGFKHEHMRQELVALLDPEKVIEEFMRTQGWSRQKVINQVLTPLEEAWLLHTPEAESESIMCYQIPAHLTKNGKAIAGGRDITASDHAFAAALYPKTD